MLEIAETFARAARSFDERVRAVPEAAWGAQSPCAQWTVHDVVNHIVSEQLWAPPLLQGATIEEVGSRYDGDMLGDDPVGAWAAAAAGSVAAWRAVPSPGHVVHLSAGPTEAIEYAEQMVLDLTVHGWDVARGAGLDERLDAGLVEHVLAYADRHAAAWSGSSFFAAPRRHADENDPQDRLLALLGR